MAGNLVVNPRTEKMTLCLFVCDGVYVWESVSVCDGVYDCVCCMCTYMSMYLSVRVWMCLYVCVCI